VLSIVQMAEAAGLVVGVVALAGLFNNTVECFELIQLGRNFGQNFQTCQLKLDNAKLRLSRWGKSWGLSDDIQDAQSLEDRIGSENIKHAEALLGQILFLFANAEGLSNNYKSQRKANDTSLVVYNPQTDLESGMVQLHLKMRQLSLERQNRAGLRQKAKWALYEEKHFKRLIEDIVEHLNGLTELFSASHELQRNLCAEEVSQISEGLPVLKQIAADQDPTLAEALAKVSGGNTASYHTVFSGSNNSGLQIAHNSGTMSGFTFGKGN
jgi:Prion-inhibition and propagation/SesB domain on fungal death-pathway protein